MNSKIAFAYTFLSIVSTSICISQGDPNKVDLLLADQERIETFTFPSNGIANRGKIFLPSSFPSDQHLPAIYLIDFTEQHFKVATDEFEKLIDGVRKVQGLDALVVSLENIPEVDAEPETFQEQYDLFKDMASYVDKNYTSNTTRTLVGKGSESGIVLMALFAEDSAHPVFVNFIATDPSPKYASALIKLFEEDQAAKDRLNKKLHFSFSRTNDRATCNKLINLINEAQYTRLEFEAIEYSDSDYENTYPISYPAGIKFIFQ